MTPDRCVYTESKGREKRKREGKDEQIKERSESVELDKHHRQDCKTHMLNKAFQCN